MKKLLIVCSFALLSTSVSAQLGDFRIGGGIGVGTTGIVIDASATYGEYFGARFGVNIMPAIKVNKSIDLKTEDKNKALATMTSQIKELNTQLAAKGLEQVDLSRFPNGNLPNNLDIQGKLSNTTWHLLFDIYPFGAKSSFHATIGAYFGKSEIIDVVNREEGFLKPINAYNNAVIYANKQPATDNVRKVVDKYNLKMIGAELGDYFVSPNPADNGNVKAYAEVAGFRPYLGVGFGRAVPKKRIGCQFDLGVQFWGKPDVYIPTYDKDTGVYSNEKIDAENAGDDAGKILKVVSKFSVYPVLNFRLVGRIL